jgi:hypothetical protein
MSFEPIYIINPDTYNHYPYLIEGLCANHTPEAIALLEQICSKKFLCGYSLSCNPYATHILQKNEKYIHWKELSYNRNAIHILKRHLNKISWNMLSSNPNGFELLKFYFENKHLSNTNNNSFTLSELFSNLFEQIKSLFNNSKNDINWTSFANHTDPRILSLLKSNLDKLDKLGWKCLSLNPNAIDILAENLDKVWWRGLSGNPNAIHLLEQNMDKVDWETLSSNPNAIHLLEQNMSKISWPYIAWNPNAIHLLKEHWDIVKKFSYLLSRNPSATRLLKEDLIYADWFCLSLNPNAIDILENNFHKIRWDTLPINPNAIDLLRNNLDKLDKAGWYLLGTNKNVTQIICRLDFASMRIRNEPFAKELSKYVVVRNERLLCT